VGNLQSIHIIVKNGHVTLEGFVSSAADKNVAGLQANSVPNVFSVKNNLQIETSK
jgi:osmotically-inducible protein OsmY